MAHLAASLFKNINILREDANACNTLNFHEVWATRECQRNFEDVSTPAFVWNKALS